MVFGGDEGSSALTATFSVAVFLGFLLLASQTLVHLTARSTVTAVAFDTARLAAAHGSDCGGGVEQRARARLGSWGREPGVLISCVRQGGRVDVRVSGPSPARGLGLLPGFDRLERRVVVRAERPTRR